MQRLLACFAILSLELALSTPAGACGEGLFNMGQGLRYQGYLAPRPATVLIYDDNPADAQTRNPIYHGLAQAGHHVTVAHDPADLARALRMHRYDVVITDFDRIDAVPGRDAVRTALLPVVPRSQRDAPALRDHFRLFLLDGASLGQYLKQINQLLASRAP